jgi:hypothetical protein
MYLHYTYNGAQILQKSRTHPKIPRAIHEGTQKTGATE